MAEVSLQLLGPLALERDGRSVELTAAKAVALLGYLAVSSNRQTREHLADLLWPDSLPEAARKNLRNTLWTVRKALGEEVLETDGDWVVLASNVVVDTRRLESAVGAPAAKVEVSVESLGEAVALYRGAFLEGVTVSDAPEFELWLTSQRERFSQLYLRALEALVAHHQRMGDWAAVIPLAEQALAHDRLQEPMYRALMEAHGRRGDRATALREYENLRNTLARELGVEPLPESEALYKALRNGGLETQRRTDDGRRQTAARSSDGRRSSVGGHFVNRRTELAALDAELERAAAGEARVVLLTGELGIGKTRLWEAWSSGLPANLVPLATRCLDTTQSLPFAPIASLLRQSACAIHLFASPSPLPAIWLTELARLLPELEARFPEMTPATLPAEEERHRLFEALVQALTETNSQPLILFIDDLHWADRTTLDWLVYLVDRLREQPFLLVGAYRSSEAPASLVHVVVGWTRTGLVRKLSLDRLGRDEAFELASELGIAEPARLEALYERSAGNPYVLLELARSEGEEMPPALAELVRERLQRLPGITYQLLQAAAVLDTQTSAGVLRRTSGRGEEETLDALDALLEAGVLLERGGSYEFAQPLVAAVVREDMSIARRSFLHRRAAEALQALYGGRLEQVAGRLVEHYRQAGQPARAAHYADMAVQQALRLAAYAEAVAFARQAMVLEATPTRQLALGRALYLASELEAAREAYREALQTFEANGDEASVARAYLRLAESYLPTGEEDVLEWAGRALRLEAELDPASLAHAHFLMGEGLLRTDQPLAEAERWLRRASELVQQYEIRELMGLSQFELGNLLAQRGDLAGALARYEETIRLARAANNPYQEVVGHNNYAYHALLSGDLLSAREHIETALRLVDKYALFLPRLYLYSTSGEIALAERRLDIAEDWFRRALALAGQYGNALQAANLRANLGLVARARGALDEALLLLEGAREEVAHMRALHLQSQIDLWLVETHQERGEEAAAREILGQVKARLAGGERLGLLAWAERLLSVSSKQ